MTAAARRPLPRAAALLFGFALAAACGADGASSEPEPVVCAAGQIDGDLLVVNQTSSPVFTAVEQFERRYGVVVEEQSYDSDEDLLARVSAGADPVDLILMEESLAYVMGRNGLLLTLDPLAVPGRSNLIPRFDPARWSYPAEVGEGFLWVPYLWGTVGVGVNVNLATPEIEPTWELIFDLDRAWVYAGRISLMEDPRQALAAALFHLGHSPNTSSPQQVAEAADLLAATRALLTRFDSVDYARRLVDGAVDVAHGRSDVFFEVIPDGSADFDYVIPREGAVIWADVMAAPVTARSPCTAHSFIDFILEPRISAGMSNNSGLASPNREALDYINPLLTRNPVIYPPPETMNALVRLELDEELERLYSDEFLRVTSF